MAVLAVAAAGAAVGWGVGGTLVAAQIGWGIGSMLGSTLFQKTQRASAPIAPEIRITGTEYGQPIPFVQGAAGVAGQLWWKSARRTISTTTSSGGKGGGPKVESTTYTYDIDLLYGLTDNEIIGVSRVWINGALIYNVRHDATPETLAASFATDAWQRITVYTGDVDQLPDPVYEAAVGSANASAYIGRGSVFIQGLNLGSSGQLPNIVFEVVTKANTSEDDASVIFQTRFVDNNPTDESIYSGGSAFDNHPTHPAALAGDSAIVTGNTGTGARWTSDIFNQLTSEVPENNGVCIEFFANVGAIPSGFSCNWFRMTWINNVTATELFAAFSNIPHGRKPFFRYNGTSESDQQTTISLPETRFHFALQFDIDGDRMRVYVDGELSADISRVPVFGVGQGGVTSGAQFQIGTGIGYAGPPQTFAFEHTFYEIRIRKGVFYTDDFTPPETFGPPDFDTQTIEPLPEDLDDVVSMLCVRSGLSQPRFDVTQLANITKPVRSLVVPLSPARQPIELLMSTHYFECVPGSTVKFVPRGGSPVVTIPYEDLGASSDGRDVEPLALRMSSEIELPAQIALTYPNVDNDYQADTQYSDRIQTASQNVVQVNVQVGLTPAEAKAIADTMLWDQYVSACSSKISVLGDYTRLEPTDPVIVTDKNGNEFRMRLVKRTDSYPMLEFELVLDDTSILQDQGITSVDYSPQTVVNPPASTVMDLMDIPIIRDTDDDPGFYVSARGSNPTWPGASILQSSDDLEYLSVAEVLEPAVSGTCTTTLGDWTGPRVFDEQNSVTVTVSDGEISNTTRSAILDSRTENLFLVGSELIQVKSAEVISSNPNVYKLSGLLRGCFGTEWAMVDHGPAERIVKIQPTGVRRVPMNNSLLGISRYYRGVTLGRRLSTATAAQFSNMGIGLKPYSPFAVRVYRDGSENVTVTWERRTRLSSRFGGDLGASYPLGEDSEAYEVDVYEAASPESLVRTISVTTNEAEYTAAEQTSDGLTPGTPLTFIVHQVSATVGRGYSVEKTA